MFSENNEKYYFSFFWFLSVYHLVAELSYYEDSNFLGLQGFHFI